MELTWENGLTFVSYDVNVVIYTFIIRTKEEKNKTRTGHKTANGQKKKFLLTNKGAHARVHTHIHACTHTKKKENEKRPGL